MKSSHWALVDYDIEVYLGGKNSFIKEHEAKATLWKSKANHRAERAEANRVAVKPIVGHRNLDRVAHPKRW